MKRYVIYRRVSTDEQGKSGLGLEAQDRDIRLYLEGYSDQPFEVVAEFTEVASGSDDRRPELTKALDIARKHGATTICITSSGSPLASAAHIHLAADHPEGYDRYSPMTSRLLHLTIIDVLATVVALRMDGAKLLPRLKDIRTNLRSKRYA